MVRDCYKEIFKLRDMLDKAGIPYICENGFMNGLAIAYPNRENMVCSAIEHDGSYGRENDKIEIMGLLTEEESEYDDVAGWLTAEDVFGRIKTHYESK